MRKLAGTVCLVLALICFLLAIWDPANWMWLKYVLTGVVALVVGAALMTPGEPQRRP